MIAVLSKHPYSCLGPVKFLLGDNRFVSVLYNYPIVPADFYCVGAPHTIPDALSIDGGANIPLIPEEDDYRVFGPEIVLTDAGPA